eukprot:jgi/Botrbrau1/14867/Bobra.0298s0001.1
MRDMKKEAASPNLAQRHGNSNNDWWRSKENSAKTTVVPTSYLNSQPPTPYPYIGAPPGLTNTQPPTPYPYFGTPPGSFPNSYIPQSPGGIPGPGPVGVFPQQEWGAHRASSSPGICWPPNSHLLRKPRDVPEANSRSATPSNLFLHHLNQEQLQPLLKTGRLLKGQIRINPANPTQAYVTLPGLPNDILVQGPKSQNRAIEGDEVAIQVLPEAEWWEERGPRSLPASPQPSSPFLPYFDSKPASTPGLAFRRDSRNLFAQNDLADLSGRNDSHDRSAQAAPAPEQDGGDQATLQDNGRNETTCQESDGARPAVRGIDGDKGDSKESGDRENDGDEGDSPENGGVRASLQEDGMAQAALQENDDGEETTLNKDDGEQAMLQGNEREETPPKKDDGDEATFQRGDGAPDVRPGSPRPSAQEQAATKGGSVRHPLGHTPATEGCAGSQPAACRREARCPSDTPLLAAAALRSDSVDSAASPGPDAGRGLEVPSAFCVGEGEDSAGPLSPQTSCSSSIGSIQRAPSGLPSVWSPPGGDLEPAHSLTLTSGLRTLSMGGSAAGSAPSAGLACSPGSSAGVGAQAESAGLRGAPASERSESSALQGEEVFDLELGDPIGTPTSRRAPGSPGSPGGGGPRSSLFETLHRGGVLTAAAPDPGEDASADGVVPSTRVVPSTGGVPCDAGVLPDVSVLYKRAACADPPASKGVGLESASLDQAEEAGPAFPWCQPVTSTASDAPSGRGAGRGTPACSSPKAIVPSGARARGAGVTPAAERALPRRGDVGTSDAPPGSPPLGRAPSEASGVGAPASCPPPEDCWLCCTSPEQALELLAARQAAKPGWRPKGAVMAILEKSKRRDAIVGVLRREAPNNLILLPCDARIPRCFVVGQLPSAVQTIIKEDPGKLEKLLVSGVMVAWPSSSPLPQVSLRQSLGQSGEIEPETRAILEQCGIVEEPFSPEVLACLPETPWSIPAQELASRLDLREKRVISIDPPTAKDLDDALSIEPLPGGGWRVGVHIADVSFFVKPGSALDQEARNRGTSVYLVQRVLPMLPHLLCEQLCSLNPGVDRLAFSVLWDLNDDGEVQRHWVGRSVIRTCAKLAYSHAQCIIEGRAVPEEGRPQLYNGVPWSEVEGDVVELHKLAQNRRKSRFESGALHLDNRKLRFNLDQDGNPTQAAAEVMAEANWLVEEFMLLANMTVARIIAEFFPKNALLRQHAPPRPHKLREVELMAAEMGIPIDATSAGGLHRSLEALRQVAHDGGLVDIVQHLMTKPMVMAKYFCTGDVEDPTDWGHYALAVPFYTHFTSPIRRYPDIIVHRLLLATLDTSPLPPLDGLALPQHRGGGGATLEELADMTEELVAGVMDPAQCALVAKHCNDRKSSAKTIQEASCRLHLCVMLKVAPIVTEGVAVGLGGNKFADFYVPEFSCECRVYADETAPSIINWHWDKEKRVLTISKMRAARHRENVLESVVGPDLLASARNPAGIQPLPLPATLQLFTRVPIVLTARFIAECTRPTALHALLYITDGHRASTRRGAARAAARQQDQGATGTLSQTG